MIKSEIVDGASNFGGRILGLYHPFDVVFLVFLYIVSIDGPEIVDLDLFSLIERIFYLTRRALDITFSI